MTYKWAAAFVAGSCLFGLAFSIVDRVTGNVSTLSLSQVFMAIGVVAAPIVQVLRAQGERIEKLEQQLANKDADAPSGQQAAAASPPHLTPSPLP